MANFIVVLFQEIVTATSTFNNHHPDQSVASTLRQDSPPGKYYDLMKPQKIALFSDKAFF